jgi:cytochrome c5
VLVCVVWIGVWIGVCVGVAVPVRAQDTARIWQGVYTATQAERGKTTFNTACIRCHGADLAGTTAPALKGDRFMTTFGNESVDRLFLKIRDTMPPNFGSTLDDSARIDIVSYILQTNGFPPGGRDLTASGDDLAGVQILRQGEQANVTNFSLVQTVGCLARGPNESWVLINTAEPAATRDDAPTADALTTAAGRPLGNGTFLLLNAGPHSPTAHQGHKMEARGLVYRDPVDARLTLTSLQMVGTCRN